MEKSILSDQAIALKASMQATKVDDNTIAVTVQPPTPPVPVTPAPVTTNYNRIDLEKQVVDIKTQWYGQVKSLIDQINQINTDCQAELDKVNALLALCDENGVLDTPPVAPDMPENAQPVNKVL